MTTTKPTKSFWLISILALIWNILGAIAYLIQAYMTDEMIVQLPEEQQKEFLYDHPAWYTALFGLAVFGGVLGCILLLFLKICISFTNDFWNLCHHSTILFVF